VRRAARLMILLLFPRLVAAAPARPLTVILDPGHGGTNAGAFGPEAGLPEKRLTLELCQRVAARLRWLVPGARVALTRTRDEYLTLAERVRRANAQQASLFVSVHANASETRSRDGFETFILSRDASDRESGRLALLENGASAQPRSSHGGGALPAILADLRHSAAHAASLALARDIQRRLSQARGADRNRGVRQAPFDVLMGLRMPAVLVEVGYLDHPIEGPELRLAAVQDRIAAAIAAAVHDHWAGRVLDSPPSPTSPAAPRAGR
jgi:N-acetylmuramoyl-L-alanine amidase